MEIQKDFPILDRCRPSTCIGGKMMRCNRLVAQIFRKHLKPFDLTNSQLSTLFIIAKKQGVSQQELASMLVMEKSTVSRNLKRLFDKEYVFKEAKQIHITTNGKVFLEEVIPVWEDAMKEVTTMLQSEGVEALDLVLSRLR